IKVKQFKDSEKSIRYKIWGAIRELCNAEFEAFSKYENDDKIIYEQYQLELNTIKEQGDNNNKKIKELRDQISNIDATIDSINQRLKLLGIYGFSIKKHTESNDKYIISRSENTTDKDVYRSLSEGEKTLITFLYFLECCKGKTDKNDTDMRDVFIVIDDPI
ncbi:TPA: AAA family ATPase, partial [Salmonella enterica]|nr:AAA family ATPase [Salmonella enterica]